MTPPEAGIVLELARTGDAAAIALLSRQFVEDGLGWSWTPRRVAASVRAADRNVLVARCAAQVVGFGVMHYAACDAHLELLGVQPDHRGRGLGRRILEWLEAPARAGGLAVVWLEVRASRTDAIAFYERLGYRTVARLDRYYEGRETALRMAREPVERGMPAGDGRS
jgi:ribosomal-protein-alanine N-acetyltransferase